MGCVVYAWLLVALLSIMPIVSLHHFSPLVQYQATMEQRALEAKQAQRRVEFAQALAEHIRINGARREEEKLFEAAQSDEYV